MQGKVCGKKRHTKTEIRSEISELICGRIAAGENYNLTRDILDSYWENHKELGVIVRYADDAVIMCRKRTDAELAFEHLKRIMTKLKLTLNPQKTKIVDMNKESFDFLGFCFQKFGKTKSGRKLPYMMPSKKAIKKVKDAVE